MSDVVAGFLTRRDVMAMRFYPKITSGQMTWEQAYEKVDEERNVITPICVKCQQMMRCSKNHRVVHDPAVGEFPETYWVGDEFVCPICRIIIVTGFANRSFQRNEISVEDAEQATPFVHSVEHRHLLDQYSEESASVSEDGDS